MNIKKITECNVIRSVNPLYLRILYIKGQFEKGKDDAYKKLADIFESIKNEIIEKTWDALEYDKDYMKIKFDSNNIFLIDKVNIYTAATMVNTILIYF